MKNIVLLFGILFAFSQCTQQSKGPNLPDEIDFFKDDYSMAYHSGEYFQNVKTDWGKLGFRGKVKSVHEDLPGNSNVHHKINVFFNENGRITRMEQSNDFHSYVQEFMYDNEGKLIKTSEDALMSMAGGKKDKRHSEKEFRYNDKGQLTTNDPAFYVYAPNGMLITCGYMTFDETTGQLIKGLNSNGYAIVCEYDENGHCIKKTEWQEGGTGEDFSEGTECVYTYTYNDKNDIATKTANCKTIYADAPDETYSYDHTYSYTYDEQGNWTQRGSNTRKIEYY